MGIQQKIDALLRSMAAVSALCATLLAAPTLADPQSLRSTYADMRAELAHNAFHAPINLISKITDNRAHGDVYAVMETPFDTLRDVLDEPSDWCRMMILHINVKACTYQKQPNAQLRFYVGRKKYETPDQAYELQYRFHLGSNSDTDLQVNLSAAHGPLGTSDYHMELEAIPLDDQHSFLHFTYSYNYNWVAKAALDVYLSTLGRNKVGFTVTGRDADGNPEYIKGIQGIAERNSMRYFLAIEATLETINVPADDMTARFNRWYDLIQRYPRQLVEYTRAEYLDRKAAEYKNQIQLQQSKDKPTEDG